MLRIRRRVARPQPSPAPSLHAQPTGAQPGHFKRLVEWSEVYAVVGSVRNGRKRYSFNVPISEKVAFLENWLNLLKPVELGLVGTARRRAPRCYQATPKAWS